MTRIPSTRRDGWTAHRQLTFLRWLEEGHSIAVAAEKAGMARESAYRFRRRDPRSLFALTWSYLELMKGGGKGHAPAPRP